MAQVVYSVHRGVSPELNGGALVMSPFGGDPRFHALFAQIREDELARRARRQQLVVQGERPAPRVRAVVAKTLRRVADRLAPAEAPAELRPPQRDAAPRTT